MIEYKKKYKYVFDDILQIVNLILEKDITNV